MIHLSIMNDGKHIGSPEKHPEHSCKDIIAQTYLERNKIFILLRSFSLWLGQGGYVANKRSLLPSEHFLPK